MVEAFDKGLAADHVSLQAWSTTYGYQNHDEAYENRQEIWTGMGRQSIWARGPESVANEGIECGFEKRHVSRTCMRRKWWSIYENVSEREDAGREHVE